MTVTTHTCWCGEAFTAPGTVHGQPAGLWQLLQHQHTNHGNGDLDAFANCDDCGSWPTHAPACPRPQDHQNRSNDA